jgi:UDP-N-acetylglucosamine diphosphorylase/glucosamine-1-phosphate N-acetyltransferase
MQITVFEDHHIHQLLPITLGRPGYAILCGSYRLVDWIGRAGDERQGIVRPHLQAIQQADFPDLADSLAANVQAPRLLLNARLVPSAATFRHLDDWLKRAEPGIVRHGSVVAAALLPASAPALPTSDTCDAWEAYLQSPPITELAPAPFALPLFDYPHDVIRANIETLSDNLTDRLSTGNYQEIADGVFAAEGAELGPYVVTDTDSGPIVLEAEARVGPFCCLDGPVHIGSHTRVIEHAVIKDHVSIGDTAKIGGEVEASVIESYTNKQHHGFLGHSYLGSWINLGAGTCNSDLKNTYGEVKMEYGGHKVATDMQFVGCIIGDYAKTAINTGIFTGKIIGACSMAYGFVTTNVPSFVNYARLFGQVSELPPDIMVATQRRMFQRRNVPQRPCDIQLLHDMYQLTQHERRLVAEPLPL